MAAKLRLFSICEVELKLTRRKPPQLVVAVHGYAVSSGWTDPEVVPLEKKLSADGILDLAFVGTPPASISLPALTPQSAGLVWTDDVDRLVGVRVVSRTNEVVRLVVEEPTALATTDPVGEETTQIAGEGLHPHYAAAAARAAATTMAVGEEGCPPISTMATGEETVFTTFPTAEEQTTNVGRRAEDLLVEPHGWSTERAAATTMAVGEETVFTTLPTAEEQTTNVGRRAEDLLVEPHGWSTARTAATTAPLIEETTQMVGEGPHPTTLVVGEECGYGGTTAPLIEETTQIAGEGWEDPQNQNPLGRR